MGRIGAWTFVAAGAFVLAALGAWLWLSGAGREPRERSRTAYEAGNWAQAAEAARAGLKDRPDDPELLRLRARSLERLGRADESLDTYGRLDAGSMEAEDFTRLGSALLGRGNRVLAWPAFAAALEADPGQAEAKRQLDRLAAEAGNDPDAAEVAERFAPISGAAPRGRILLGLLGSARDVEPRVLAEALLRTFREVRIPFATTPPKRLIETILARTLLALGRPEEAGACLEAVLADGPDAESSWLLSRARLQRGDKAGAEAATRGHAPYGSDRTSLLEPSPYVGAVRCGECHGPFYQTQQHSAHARSFPTPAEVGQIDLPDRPMKDPHDPSVLHEIRKSGEGGVEVETRAGGSTFRALVEYAFGSGEHGLTLVGREDSGQLRELRLSHYGSQVGWDRTTGHPTAPGEPGQFLGRPLTATDLHACLGCHTTEIRSARDHAGPTATDRGIGCERCHGPGGNHVKAVELGFADPAIALPAKARAAEVTELCGQCHRPAGGNVPSGSRAAVRFQASAFPQSRCYDPASTSFTCVTCHNPHRDARSSKPYYVAKCLSCHGTGESVAGGKGQLPPCPVNPTENCLDCHMPRIENVLAHTAFTDHHIRVRDSKDESEASGK
jgi:tetratricopeptide (TPR) repeat protein